MSRSIDWSSLPVELVEAVAKRVPCPVDRTSMALARRSWLCFLAAHIRLVELPWLLRPTFSNRLPSGDAKLDFFCLPSNGNHQIAVGDGVVGFSCIGSHEGGWIILAGSHSHTHSLHSVLPSAHPNTPKLHNLHSRYNINLPTQTELDYPSNIISIHLSAVAISGDPAGDDQCIVAAIVTPEGAGLYCRQTMAAFWRRGCTNFKPDLLYDLEDVIVHNGTFHFLNRRGGLWRYNIVNNVASGSDDIRLVRYRYVFDEGPSVPVSSLYLVSCDGSLYMVSRITNQTNGMVSGFTVHKLCRKNSNVDVFIWERLDRMEGKVFFVQHGSSRSYEAAKYNGAKEGIYYRDERETINTFGGVSYKTNDNGHWCMETKQVKSLSPGQVTFSYSSPVWVINNN